MCALTQLHCDKPCVIFFFFVCRKWVFNSLWLLTFIKVMAAPSLLKRRAIEFKHKDADTVSPCSRAATYFTGYNCRMCWLLSAHTHTHRESRLVGFFLPHPTSFLFLVPRMGRGGVCADPDRRRTAFNNRRLTLRGVSVWFHCLRQTRLNITQTPPCGLELNPTVLIPHFFLLAAGDLWSWWSIGESVGVLELCDLKEFALLGSCAAG